MTSAFAHYEIEVLKFLLRHNGPFQELSDVLEQSESINIEYTGYGFFSTATNSQFGNERQVYSDPLICVKTDEHTASFVAFLENSELTLETFPVNGIPLPPDFRDRHVTLEYPR